jgi:hypothetical protein
MAALRSSCVAYDDGHKWEAFRIAVSVYALVYDGNQNNISLLTRLGLWRGLRFVSTSEAVQGYPLVFLSIGMDENGPFSRHVPQLDKARTTLVQFSRWWDATVVKDKAGSLSRKNLIFGMRNKEGGGAHFDETFKPDYHRITRVSPLESGLLYVSQEGQPVQAIPALGIETAVTRQIGWEVLKTLDGVNVE